MNESKTDETVLIELNRRIGEAEKARDDQFMAEILSEKLVFRRASGIAVNKTNYLENLANPANTYDQLDVSEIEVQIFQDVAVVSLCVQASGQRGDKSFSGRFRNLRIFMKEVDAPHGWRCHMWFNTKEKHDEL